MGWRDVVVLLYVVGGFPRGLWVCGFQGFWFGCLFFFWDLVVYKLYLGFVSFCNV